MSDGPDASVHIGVTGHRPDRLTGTDIAMLRARVREALTTVVSGIPNVPAFVLSPLAEGADRIVAHEALAAGLRLICPLPFPRDAYALDFAGDASRQEYCRLLQEADAVVELPGRRDTPEAVTAAYAALGQYMIEAADLLIAIWDGRQARGAGGTAQVVTEALASRLPVLWIAAQPPHQTRVITHDGAGSHRDGTLADVPAIVAQRLAERSTRRSRQGRPVPWSR